MNIVDRIRAENSGRDQNIAVVEDNLQLRYSELLETVEQWRRILEQAGIRRHDRVGFLCEDSLDYICLSLAILASGAALVPISPSLSLNEAGPALDCTDAAWFLYDSAATPLRDGCELDGPLLRRKFKLASRSTRGDRDAEFRQCDPAFVRFSSGTTGASKGVVLSHRAVYERTEAADRALCITASDRILWVLSMSFHFVVTILLFLRRGACILLCGNDFPGTFIRRLAQGQGTFLYASPFHFDLLSGAAELSPAMFKHIRLAVSTAMPLASDIADRFENRFGLPLCQAYGIIEVGLPFIQEPGELRRQGSVGRIGADYQIHLLEPDANGVGEVLLRGPGMFHAYCAPWRTRLEIDPEGWFHTGDLGRLDGDGCLFLAGRLREVINFAGMKIFPAEVEAVLNQHPGVSESRVFAEPHARYGQWPVAQIVPSGTPMEERELRRFCYARLAAFQVPKRFESVAAIARTASGKLKRG